MSPHNGMMRGCGWRIQVSRVLVLRPFTRPVLIQLGLLLILLVGCYARLSWARRWNGNQPNTAARLVGDEPGYDNLARDFLRGHGYTWPGRVPLYPLWLAGVYTVMGDAYNWVAYPQTLLGVITIALAYQLGRRVLNAWAGVLAALGVALSYILIHQSLHLLSEVLYTPLALQVTISIWDAYHAPSLKRWAWAGVWVGLSNLTRPTLLLFPVVVLGALWLKHRSRQSVGWGLCLNLSAALIIMPWVIHNYWRYQAWFPLQTSNAILWQGSPEYYHLLRDQGYTYDRVWQEVLYGPGWEAHDPTSLAGDRYWTARALQSIQSEPLTYGWYALEKALTYWVGDPNADWGDTYVFNYSILGTLGFPPDEAQAVMVARVLPLVALLAGLVLRPHAARLWPLYLVLLYFTALHAATHAEARLSDPLQPQLWSIIAGAAVTLLPTQKTLAPEPITV